eukprot:346232-Chlamydomonas_euryale.AAC.1
MPSPVSAPSCLCCPAPLSLPNHCCQPALFAAQPCQSLLPAATALRPLPSPARLLSAAITAFPLSVLPSASVALPVPLHPFLPAATCQSPPHLPPAAPAAACTAGPRRGRRGRRVRAAEPSRGGGATHVGAAAVTDGCRRSAGGLGT